MERQHHGEGGKFTAIFQRIRVALARVATKVFSKVDVCVLFPFAVVYTGHAVWLFRFSPKPMFPAFLEDSKCGVSKPLM